VTPTGARVRLHDQQSGPADLVTTYSTDQTPAMAGLVGAAVQGTWALEVADLVRKDQGRLRGWSIDLELQAAGPALRGETAPGVAIPDSPGAGVESTIVLTEAPAVGEVQVAVDISHPAPADLVVRLVPPSGEPVVLHDRRDTGQRGVVATYNSSSTPGLAALRGRSAGGAWMLQVTDMERKDTGTLNRWSLQVEPGQAPTGLVAPDGATPVVPDLEVTVRGSTVEFRVGCPDEKSAEDFVIELRGWFGEYRQRALAIAGLARGYSEARDFLQVHGGAPSAPRGPVGCDETPYYLNLVAGW